MLASLGVIVAVALAGIGMAQAQLPAPPSSCSVQVLDSGLVEVTWSGGPDLVDIIRNGQTLSTVFLREEGARFIDDGPPGGVTTYEMAGRNRFGDPRAETIHCGTVQTVAELPLARVSSCSVELDEYDRPSLNWTAATGAQAYVVRLNGVMVSDLQPVVIDGVDIHATTQNTFYLSNSEYAGFQTEHYSVASMNANGQTDKTYCGKIVPEDLVDPQVPATPPSSCSVFSTASGTDVTWAAGPNSEFSIWRNGHIIHVQEDKDGNRWIDGNPPTGTVHYSVSGNANGDVSAKRYCGSVNVTTPVPVSTSCSVTNDSVGFNVRWSGIGDGEVVIRRSVDGSPWYWRGRTAASTFADTSRSGDVRYHVAPRTADGRTGAPTLCTMS